ncbi:MAG TPA: PQQ-binding-like beta-propeller repeat protein [Candidatus Bathyarchaeia archaeon]|nr:PQQ-binding-like beta-propeller repeat protein [Candidatus Bathyarchaeia archaeon]
MKKRNRENLLAAFISTALLWLVTPLVYLEPNLLVNAESAGTSDNWPMFLHDPQHTGYSQSQATIPNTNSPVWIRAFSDDGSKLMSPIVVDGLVIVASNNGHLYAFSSMTGEIIWTYELWTGVNSVNGVPAVSSGRIFVGSIDHKMYSLNASTGDVLWSFQAGGGIWSSPIVVENRVIFTSDDTKLYSLNASNGAQLWNRTTWGSYTSPAFWNGTVFVTGQALYAVNASNGEIDWSYSNDASYPESSPVVSDGKVFFSTGNSSVFSIDASNGTYIWGSKLSGQLSQSSPVAANGRLFLGSDNGYIYSLNASSGSLLWRYETQGAISSSAAVADGKVFFASSDRNVYAFAEGNGTLLWKYQLGQDDGNIGSPAIYDGKVFIVSKSTQAPFLGKVYALGRRPQALLSADLTLSLNSPTSFIGFKVNLTGTLKGNGTGIGNATIRLFYSVAGGQTWTEITSTQTSTDGSYFATWIPSATGTYIIMVIWAGNETYGLVSMTKMLSVSSVNDQYVFSVVSNSTVSALTFNSASKQLSFTVTGETGTEGFVDMTIAKSLVANIVDLKVYLDGVSINYVATSTDDSWLMHFTYTHSTHTVTVNLGVEVIPEFPTWTILPVIALIQLFAIALFKKKLKTYVPN